jgi:hypothetical protein
VWLERWALLIFINFRSLYTESLFNIYGKVAVKKYGRKRMIYPCD